MGRLLAWLARECSNTTHHAHIKSADGTWHYTPDQINAQFKSFYEDLYSSRITYDTDSLTGFLDTIEFPELLLSTRQCLDVPFTMKEIQAAISSLQTVKTPGPDGLPAKFY